MAIFFKVLIYILAIKPANSIRWITLSFTLSFLSITHAVDTTPIVSISPGAQVTEQDIAQFDARWMGADRQQRLDSFGSGLKNRRAYIAWGIGEDASAMVRMFKITHDRKYLEHLRDINNIALRYRDDNHPGDDFPAGNNPICLNCRPPFVDRERNLVAPAAWGSGIIYTDYVIDGGLTPVGDVTSGVYAYGIAAFARIVAEDPSLQADYGADAVRFANAAKQTMEVFIPQFYTRQVGGYVEGTFYRPVRFPTSAQCTQAHNKAIRHVRQFSGEDKAGLDDLRKRIGKAKSNCNKAGGYANKPLAHNQSGALIMTSIELWRALDSEFYRRSSLRASDADQVRGVIPLIVARHQRYFVNRLKISNNEPQGQYYWWLYNDDVPDPKHIEDTSHSNLVMFYLDVLRQSFDRLNAEVAPGEPIALDDVMLRRFANTFLGNIARPDEIDRGGNLRSNVDGRAAADNGKGGSDYNNPLWDGWVNLASVDATIYRLCRNVSLRTNVRKDEVFQDYLIISNHAALLANKRFSDDLTRHVIDRTAQSGTPTAVGLPTAAVIPGLAVHNIAYRDTLGQLHELWRDAHGATGTTNLTANAGAPTAVGNPFAYVDTSRNTEILLYRSVDGTVRSLYWSTGAVGHDNLSGTAGAPKAAGNPVGYYTPAADAHHVIYRSGDGHLHELNWIGVAPVNYGGNLTAAISAPTAVGDPTAFVNAAGVNIVVYRGTNGHILSLYWADGPSGLDDLSGFAGTPAAAGDPAGYYTAHDDTHQVVYRGGDGHLYELYWPGVAPVVGWDITALSAAPVAVGNPVAYYSVGTNTKHVIYRSADGRLHEIWWVPGSGTPSHVDLTSAYGAPLAADQPAAFTVEGPNTQHVVYRGTDNHIYEIRW